MLDYENRAIKKGFSLIVGIDEAGRGPLAGPVVASAVALRKREFRQKIRDSKKINSCQREKAFYEIFENAYVGIGIASEAVIDSINILEATYYAMNQAVRQLVDRLPDSLKTPKNFQDRIFLLIDGKSFKSDFPFKYQTIIKGDDLSLSVAAASIVAKVTRDRILKTYDQILPQYGFKQHKGYPTRGHKAAIREHGLAFIHRKTFQYQ